MQQHVQASTSFSTTLVFERIWSNKRSNPSRKSAASVWRPVPPHGYIAVGDCLVTGSWTAPTSVTVLRIDDDERPLVMPSAVRLHAVLLLCFCCASAVPLLRSCCASAVLLLCCCCVLQFSCCAPATLRACSLGAAHRLQGFKFVWQDDSQYPGLTIWRPTAPPGYAALGMVATIDGQAPPSFSAYCVRLDATKTTTDSPLAYVEDAFPYAQGQVRACHKRLPTQLSR
jgi:hypothetical protein